MVNLVFGEPSCVKCVECSVVGVFDFSQVVGVLYHSTFGYCFVGWMMLVDIEITGQYIGAAMAELFDFFHYQIGPFNPCFHSYMVHVGIEYQKFLARAFFLETSPCTDTDTGGVPAETGRFGSE